MKVTITSLQMMRKQVVDWQKLKYKVNYSLKDLPVDLPVFFLFSF